MKEAGFSLLEMLAVVTLISLLIAATTNLMDTRKDRVDLRATVAQAQAISNDTYLQTLAEGFPTTLTTEILNINSAFDDPFVLIKTPRRQVYTAFTVPLSVAVNSPNDTLINGDIFLSDFDPDKETILYVPANLRLHTTAALVDKKRLYYEYD